jgi:small conductance mechanosensitive channel
MNLQSVVDYVKLFFAQYAIKVVGAMIILAVGIYVAKWIGRMLGQSFERKQMEPPLRTLLVRVVKLVILAFTIIVVAEKLGLPVMSLVAGVGVAGVGVGLAMQGVLGNLVAGLTIIFTKPFRVGDYIEIHSVHGVVAQIELFSTILTHSDRSRVLIPNRKIVGEIVHNYGTIRQLDVNVGVGYETNIGDALALVRDILQRNPRILKEFTPSVGVSTLADSSINISVKPWAAVGDYGSAQAEVYQTILEEFRTRNIQIPFPQREVRILNGAEAARAQSVAA